MNLGINKRIKFKTLLISTDIILVLVFLLIYMGVSQQKLTRLNRNYENDYLQIYHDNVCQTLRACMYEADALRSYIAKEGLGVIVEGNLNLIDTDLCQAKIEKANDSLKQLSISADVISDFIIFGRNQNQKNLYSNLTTPQYRESSLPTVDEIEKSKIDAIIHTDLGYMVYCDASKFDNISLEALSDGDAALVKNLVEYLSDSYFVCDYINGNLTIIRFNKNYILSHIKIPEDKKVILYNPSGHIVLCFNSDEAYADSVFDKIHLSDSFYEDELYSYTVSNNFYGKISAVTEQKRNHSDAFSLENIILGVSAIGIGLLFSALFIGLFSENIFKKIEFLQSVIKRQNNACHLHFIKIDGMHRSRIQLSFPQRIFLSLICSCLTSLLAVSVVFSVYLGYQTKNTAQKLSEYYVENYTNEWESCYNRYNAISTEKFKRFLSAYSTYKEKTYTNLISEFEQNFYYDISFLPHYSYGFIVNGNNEVIYQTMFSSQTKSSNDSVQKALFYYQSDGSSPYTGLLVPMYDLLSGKKTVAYVKGIYQDDEMLGSIVIVLDAQKIMGDVINQTAGSDFLVLNRENSVIVGNTDNANIKIVESLKQTDAGNKISCAYGKENKWLGRCAVITANEFYLKQLNEIRYSLLFSALLISIVCVIATLILGRILSKPFQILLDNMNETPESGYHPIRENFGADEIHNIAVSYNRMIKRIEVLAEEGVRKETERRQLEVLQARTEFKMLQQQINPHFLFNTLECINLLTIKSGQTDASKIIKSLSVILRYGLSRETRVKVGSEIKVLQSYINIQKYRFGDNFNVEYDLDESLFNVGMIKFVLQPLFENAISHGRVQSVENGKIKLTLHSYDEGIELIVADNGVGMSEAALEALRQSLSDETEEDESKTGGIGLKNVSRRVFLHYNGKGSLNINSTEGKGTQVILRLPFL